ncbi:TetR/AcrR family transcriptional regulator [Algoriphagus aquimarinus]|uniref:DNA-binding transcriptional regulator, AcrR family n=1 Tax=Algoriphagus aquimarinus TaxID=237018 RepID=A0A1I1BZQ9_9BACT|nr:TetR/AcrR family transcriptional regulator [Algoriphagus aquimarinus]SFB54108.1 DNA-binding transcriptional regulator, AcrR family [Algoriphagus aquimarinus]|tara:strand:+ start:7933 stop:8532 length:600 start_codon:yes stop_codon:yes gene_type:complete
MREKILGIASDQFSQYGVRAITMEDIARLAGISKKTIYQEFIDKKQLVKEAFSMALKEDQDTLDKILEGEDGVIEHLVHTSKMVRERLSTLNPMVLLEIQKYFPEVWEMFNQFKEEIIVTDIVNVLEKGKTLGYFRPEINAKILANMRIDQISAAMNPSNYDRRDFSLLTLHMEMLDHFLHGIFTEKGRQAYLQKRNTY